MISFFHRIVDKWIGKKVDVDGMYGSQCMDFVRQYCKEQWFPITTSGNAIDMWKRGLGSSYKRIPNNGGNFPNAWDVVIFQWPTKYGHICIASDGCTSTKLNVIEQNAQTGNGDGLGGNAIRNHTYNYITPKCIGWYTKNPS